MARNAILATLLALSTRIHGQDCPDALTPSSTPQIADGYTFAVVASGLSSPRGLQFDSAGNLLVVQQYGGITNLHFTDNGGACLSVESSVDLAVGDIDLSLNHGIALSASGTTLYASTNGSAYSWTYDAEARDVTTSYTQIIGGMENSGHLTRTLLYSNTDGEYLVASRGSAGNVDPEAGDIESGHCQLKAFDLASIPEGGYDFTADGTMLAWGLRNSVGVTEHPGTGGIWTVENSMDNILRQGVDIHQNNPGEEMNFHGTIADPVAGNHGYPYCVSAWHVDEVNDNSTLVVGSQFAVSMEELGEDVKEDAYCADQMGARLTFAAHTAPLDVKFNGTDEAWVSFHGSWNREDPNGYRLARIEFANGEPVEESTSMEAEVDILTNADLSACPNDCFRPVGIAFDSQGRLFMSSDATGEIYVVVKT